MGDLKKRADELRVRIWPGNNIGYFGPYESVLKGTMPRGHIVTSCRKFDRFGDWHAITMMLRSPVRMYRELRAKETPLIDEYYYDFNDRNGNDRNGNDRSGHGRRVD